MKKIYINVYDKQIRQNHMEYQQNNIIMVRINYIIIGNHKLFKYIIIIA